MDCCGKPMKDFSFKRGSNIDPKTPHFYCHTCGNRHLDGKDYTADEWFFYINGKTFQQHRREEIERTR